MEFIQSEDVSSSLDSKDSVDISHKFEKLFEDDDIFNELEDFENFEIIIREVPEDFEEIKEAFKTPISSLTIPAVAEKFMTDLENKEKEFNDEAVKSDDEEEIQVIDLSDLDLFDEFGGFATDTRKDKRNPAIFIVSILNVKNNS